MNVLYSGVASLFFKDQVQFHLSNSTQMNIIKEVSSGNFMLRVCILILFCIISVASADEKKHWQISNDHAGCLQTHLSEYKKVVDDPIIIFLEACPETDRKTAIQKIQKNTDPGIIVNGEEGFDKILIFNRSEIKCLDSSYFSKQPNSVLIPRDINCQ